MSHTVNDLPELTERALETAPTGAHVSEVLEIVRWAYEEGKDPAACWVEHSAIGGGVA